MNRVLDYVLENYPKKFKGVTPEVIDLGSVYCITVKDGSPLFLSKNI